MTQEHLNRRRGLGPFQALTATIVLALLVQHVFALPSAISSPDDSDAGSTGRSGYDIPIQSMKIPRRLARRGDVSGSIGLGNAADLLYTIPIRIGDTVSALHLDTGSSDMWIASDSCVTNACEGERNFNPYPISALRSTGADVQMFYGDSTTGTFATGVVGLDTAAVAGIAMVDQPFGLINDTSNLVVMFGTAGIFGLGFPSGSKVQQALTIQQSGSIFPTDSFIESTYTDGPLLSRISMTNQLEMPMFTVTLQRNTIDIAGEGLLTVGKLPNGIDNSTLTWVPLRLYNSSEGGMRPPTFAPNEVYPFRWEIDIDAVYLDGQRIADSAIEPTNGIGATRVSALLDTGNSILRGPEDVVDNILSTVSSRYDPDSQNPSAFFPCNIPHTLTFEIGGRMFPIDPRDFIGEVDGSDALECVADNIVPTDPPNIGALFRWSLGTPFFRSNLVAFHYGNLTHPSEDPPRIGILSLVPENADEVYLQAVQDARNNNGDFEETFHPAPTAQVATQNALTISQVAPSFTLTLTGPNNPQGTGGRRNSASGFMKTWAVRGMLVPSLIVAASLPL
ncbi:acid protease [Coprinopsis marcescibilis]|uniref:Acid protease n=1 Tax=Coprinopsis marcescibilis TaxID=230819 RepID=A0A5C3L4C2_COPMA|nr:acid protease [Coprinopsis marcescibilis]